MLTVNPSMDELIIARAEINKLEKAKQREITEDELIPLLHNCRTAFNDYEKDLRSNYKEKFPTYLNKEDSEALSIVIACMNIMDALAMEWIQYNRPKQAIKYLKTGRTFLGKALGEFTKNVSKEDRINLLRKATEQIEKSNQR